MQPNNKDTHIELYVSVWLFFFMMSQSFGKYSIIFYQLNQYTDCKSSLYAIVSALFL